MKSRGQRRHTAAETQGREGTQGWECYTREGIRDLATRDRISSRVIPQVCPNSPIRVKTMKKMA